MEKEGVPINKLVEMRNFQPYDPPQTKRAIVVDPQVFFATRRKLGGIYPKRD
jgi:hypothetical protein